MNNLNSDLFFETIHNF